MFWRVLGSALLFGVVVVIAFAQGQEGQSISIALPNPLQCGESTDGGEQIACIAGEIIKGLRTLAIPIVAIMVLVGGFMMMTAAGNPEKFGKGRKAVLYAVVGFAVILIAGGVVSLIKELLSRE